MINFHIENDIATIELNDGKANVMSLAMTTEIIEALDEAIENAKVTILKGAGKRFSAGFDLTVFKEGSKQEQNEMSISGFNMLYRLYSHPQPLIAVCNGHAIGLGAFLLLCSDTRIGVSGDYKIGLPETAIGMPFTPVLMSLLRQQVTPTSITAAALQSHRQNPEQAIESNFLDKVVDAKDIEATIQTLAAQLMQLPTKQYAENKLIIRAEALAEMKADLESLGVTF